MLTFKHESAQNKLYIESIERDIDIDNPQSDPSLPGRYSKWLLCFGFYMIRNYPLAQFLHKDLTSRQFHRL